MPSFGERPPRSALCRQQCSRRCDSEVDAPTRATSVRSPRGDAKDILYLRLPNVLSLADAIPSVILGGSAISRIDRVVGEAACSPVSSYLAWTGVVAAPYLSLTRGPPKSTGLNSSCAKNLACAQRFGTGPGVPLLRGGQICVEVCNCAVRKFFLHHKEAFFSVVCT